jgi:hypothetical protein
LVVDADVVAGPIYVLVVPEALGGGDAGFRLTLEPVGFALGGVGFSRAANSGTTTVPVEGRGFRADLGLSLVGPDGVERRAEEVLVRDSSSAFARFDLRGAGLGLYRLEGVSGGVRSVLRDAIEVVGAEENRLEVRLVLPETARERRPFDLYLEYRNAGETDLAIPRLSLECPGGSGEIWWPGQDESRFREPALSFVRLTSLAPGAAEDEGTERDEGTDAAEGGGVGAIDEGGGSKPVLQALGADADADASGVSSEPLVLPPGATRRVHFRSASVRGVSTVRFEARVSGMNDSDPMDYAALHAAIVPARPHPLWTNAWQRVVEGCGPTRGDYQGCLVAGAARAKGFGLDLVTEQDLLTFLVREAVEAVQTPSVAGAIFLGDFDHPLGRGTVVLRPASDPDTGPWYLTTAWYDGRFGVRDVPPGDYVVGIEGYLPAEIARLTVGNVPLSGLQWVAQSKAARLAGEVREGPEGRPVAGLVLMAREESTGETRWIGTDAEGGFEFAGLPAGRYRVSALGAGRLLGGTLATELAAGEQAWMTYFRDAGGAGIRGTVRTTGGTAVPGALVRIVPADPAQRGGLGWVRSLASEEGTGGFQANGLAPGRYRVHASFLGLGASGEVEVNLVDREGVEAVELVLGRAGRVTGVVRDADSLEPVSGARVGVDLPGWRHLQARSDVQGRFVLLDAPAGAGALAVEARGYMAGSAVLSAAAGDRGPVTIDLSPHGGVVGQVSRAGRPLADFAILLRSSDGPFRETRTDASGRYAFADLPEGGYWMAVGAGDGAWRWEDDFEVGPGRRQTTRDFRLDAAASVMGLCLQSGGTAPQAGILVALRRNGEIVARAETDGAGRYAFLVWEPGAYDLLPAGRGTIYEPRTGLALAAGESLGDVDFVAPTQRLTVRVSAGVGGGPVSEAEVEVIPAFDPEEAAAVQSVTTDVRGIGVLSGVPPGVYTVRVVRSGFGLVETSVQVEAGGGALDVALGGEAILRGRVSTPRGAVGGARVTLARPGGRALLGATSAADGSYEIRSVPGGTWDVWATAFGEAVPVAAVPVTTSVGTERVLDLRLAEAGGEVVSGTVRLPDGRSPVLAEVALVGPAGVPLAVDASGVDRGFGLRGWPAGNWDLVVGVAGHRVVRLPVALAAGLSLTNVVIRLEAPVAWGLPTPSAFPPAAVAGGSPAGVSRRALAGWNDVLAWPERILLWPGEQFARHVWPRWFGGDYGIRSPEEYIDNVPFDPYGHLRLYERAIEEGKTDCRGVLEGWKQCLAARDALERAGDDWGFSYESMRELNRADAGLVASRTALIVAKTYKLLRTLQQAKGSQPTGSAREKAIVDTLSVFANSVGLFQSKWMEGEPDEGAALGQLGSYIIALKADPQYEKAFKWTGVLREAASIALDLVKLAGDTKALVEDLGLGSSMYHAGADNYYRALLQYDDGLALMEAGMADCRTGDGTRVRPPPVTSLDFAASGSVKIITSHDPNDKLTLGTGAERFVGADELLVYTIRFENVATATAAAQEVRIVDVLDPRLAWSTFQPLAIGFNGVTLNVPEGSRQFRAQTFVASDPNPVRVTASLDTRTGVATWFLQSVDPRTGLLPDDPWAGFLPPNDAEHRGEGYVTFGIRPQPGLPDAAVITNRASIVFDANPEILTPVVSNRVDRVAPASQLRLVGAEFGGLRLGWNAHDAGGSGIARVEVYVSRDAGPYQRWPTWTAGGTDDEIVLPVEPGWVIAAYCVATDAAGNREEPPTGPDVGLEVPVVVGVVRADPVELRWRAPEGSTWVVERTDRLDPGSAWTVVSDPVTATRGVATFRETGSPQAAAFYRARAW